MLYEAVNWHDDGADERPPLDAVLAVPENARYVTDWGRAGDVALVRARSPRRARRRGVVRRFDAADARLRLRRRRHPRALDRRVPGVPRPSKVGTLLLGSIIARAERDRNRAISLSVSRDNPAKRLYARHGFEVVDESGDSLTMLLDLL